MKFHLRRAALIILNGFDGRPVAQTSLISAVQAMERHRQPTAADVAEALLDCEAAGYVSGVSDEFSGERTWNLTPKGVHKARELR